MQIDLGIAEKLFIRENIKMLTSCIVFKCSSHASKNPGLSFYKIPTIISKNNKTYMYKPKIQELSKKRQIAWLKALKLDDMSDSSIKNARVCQKHFLSGKNLHKYIFNLTCNILYYFYCQ